KEAIENAVTEAITSSLNNEIEEREAEEDTEVELTIGELDTENSENADDTTNSEGYDEFEHFGVDVTPADVYGTSLEEDYSNEKKAKPNNPDNEEAATETPAFVHSEEEPKKAVRFSAFSKARRLKELMAEQNTDNTEPTD
ncbi:MAG: hypothetical protein K2M82_05755, partial [Lachnospiraceae bacterium]|nr:hypothetical protein [Lachnospiraceae bacterium]